MAVGNQAMVPFFFHVRASADLFQPETWGMDAL